MLSSSRRLFVRCSSARLYSTTATATPTPQPRPVVKIYLHDADIAPTAHFEPGVSIMQVRDYFSVRGGGLKWKGDTENVIVKDKQGGIESGEYVLFGYQGNNPSAHLHHQQQQHQLQLQFLHHQLMQHQQQYRQQPPQQQQQQQQYPTNLDAYSSPPIPPSSHSENFQQQQQQQQPHALPQQKSNSGKPSLAQDLGIDSTELEMFPWLVDENNTKPF